MNLPRWAMDGDGGGEDSEKAETVDGEATTGGSANGRGSNCDRLPEFTGDARRNHGGGDAWGRLGLSERDTIEPIEINHEA